MSKLISLFLLLLLLSCERTDLDLVAPTLTFIDVHPNPSRGVVCGIEEDSVFHLKGGDFLTFEAALRDDQALSQFKIDIHNNFDCHGHGGASTPGFSIPSIDNQTDDWVILETEDLSGKEVNISKKLEIPSNVTAGSYHMQLQVLDESGNDIPLANIYSVILLNKTDTVPPVINSVKPELNFSTQKGSDVRFVGSVMDNFSLSAGGNGVLFLSYTDLNSGNTFTTKEVYPFDSSTEKHYDFDFTWTVPSTITAGNYLFTLRAQDGVRNIAEAIDFMASISN